MTGIWERDWHEHSSEPRIWEGIENVDDGELWETHLSLKPRLLEFVRSRAIEQAEYRHEPRELRQRLGRVLSPDALTIGFARRFATGHVCVLRVQYVICSLTTTPSKEGASDRLCTA